MKATTKEEAEKAWGKYDSKWEADHHEAYISRSSREDFKSALRAEIEESIEQERNILSNPKGYHQNDVLQCKIIVGQAEKFLNLLETTLPPKE